MTIALIATSNRKWRPPPSDYLDVHCPPLAKGRRLMKEKRFQEAATTFRTALLQLEGQPLPRPVTTGDAWTTDEIVISTRLFLLKAVWAASSSTNINNGANGTLVVVEAHALMELVVSATTSTIRPAPALELVLMACQTVARIVKEEEPKGGDNESTTTTTTATMETIMEMGIVACSASLQLDNDGSSPKQRRQFWDLQSQFCDQLGDVAGTATALEGLVHELVATQGHTNAEQCPHRKRLRALNIQLGRIDVEAEQAAALHQQEVHETKQSHKKRNRQRHRDVLSSRLGEQLTLLHPQIEIICQLGSDDKVGSDSGSFFQGLPQSKNGKNDHPTEFPAPPPSENGTCTPVTTSTLSIIDWDSVPPQLAPGASAGGGIRHHKDKRVRRKQRQLEALYAILKNLMERYEQQRKKSNTPNTDQPIHIVDFGAGSGNSCLVFAWLLRNHNCRFTLVDNKSHAVLLGQQRTLQAGLSENLVTWVCGDVAEYNDAFDIGLATHLCGGGTDLAMAKCLRHKAAFLVTPCCLGKLKFHVNSTGSGDAGISNSEFESNGDDDSLVYPRSVWLREHLSPDEYLEMTRLGDNTAAVAETKQKEDGKADKTWQLRLKGKALLDADRLELARENGYETELGRLGSKSDCGPKSDVLCGLCVAA